MKKIVIFSALAAVAVVASAQEQGRVLSATPIIQQVGVPQQVCGNETVYSGNRTTGAGAVIGAIAGGAQAAQRRSGSIAPGQWADLVALDTRAIDLEGRRGDALLDSYIFAGDDRMIGDVW